MGFLGRLFGRGGYAGHPEAVVVSCFFNPMLSEYRLRAFEAFYESIKHLNHRIVECVIGDAPRQLAHHSEIEVIKSNSLLWHKESILNGIVAKLPKEFKYVFWIDADVMFTNKNWLTESVSRMEYKELKILQPWEYCIHLNKDEEKPAFHVDTARLTASDPARRNPQIWRGFAANYETAKAISADQNYDKHGHVGFAWGARREVLDTVPLYDHALIGGADHIIAHAAAGQIPHSCIAKAFSDDIVEVDVWSRRFYGICQGKLGFVPGDLYHLWHGDIDKREYLKRVIEFAKMSKDIREKDGNGLYVSKDDGEYIRRYFSTREVTPANQKTHSGTAKSSYRPSGTPGARSVHITHIEQQQRPSGDDGFLQSMALGYMSDSMLVGMLGGNPMGAMVGSMLADHGHNHSSSGSGSTAADAGQSSPTVGVMTAPEPFQSVEPPFADQPPVDMGGNFS